MDTPPENTSLVQDRQRKSRGRLSWVLAIVFLSGAVVGGSVVACFIPRAPAAWVPTGDNRPQTLLAGAPFHPLPSVKEAEVAHAVSPGDLEFGELQVRRMVQDRPLMRQGVNPDDPVWSYCARAFGGAATGTRVFWNPDTPGDLATADHQGPFHKDPGFIRVRSDYASGPNTGQQIPCEELWSSAVFELENIRNTAAFQDLWREAVHGEMSRAVWIRENTRLEFTAMQRTAKLFHALWEEPAVARGMVATPSLWYVDSPQSYDEWIAQYDDPHDYPWSSWGRYYDEELARN